MPEENDDERRARIRQAEATYAAECAAIDAKIVTEMDTMLDRARATFSDNPELLALLVAYGEAVRDNLLDASRLDRLLVPKLRDGQSIDEWRGGFEPGEGPG